MRDVILTELYFADTSQPLLESFIHCMYQQPSSVKRRRAKSQKQKKGKQSDQSTFINSSFHSFSCHFTEALQKFSASQPSTQKLPLNNQLIQSAFYDLLESKSNKCPQKQLTNKRQQITFPEILWS